MDILEKLIWQGRATQKIQSFGLGSQFILPIGRNNTGIITKIVFSPFTFQPGTGGEFVTAPLQEIILSDGRRSIKKVIKNFESSVIKSDQAFISQGQSIISQLYFPFFSDAPIFVNLNLNNIAIQLGAPFNQLIRDGLEAGFQTFLENIKANGDALPSLDQQYWLNELFATVSPLLDTERILIFVNGLHDAGTIDFSLYDWAQPGTKYARNQDGVTAYQINSGTGSAAISGTPNFGFNGVIVPANNPGWIAYRGARFPRGGMIHGDNSIGTQTPQIGTNRNGAFIGQGARGWNQTIGTQGDMNRPAPLGRCTTFAWQQETAAPLIDYYINGSFTDQVTQPANQAIPVSENFILYGRQGQTIEGPINGVQFLHTGLTPAEILLINNAIKRYCANLAAPAPVPTTPTGVVESFLTVHYYEVQGNVLDKL